MEIHKLETNSTKRSTGKCKTQSLFRLLLI